MAYFSSHTCIRKLFYITFGPEESCTKKEAYEEAYYPCTSEEAEQEVHYSCTNEETHSTYVSSGEVKKSTTMVTNILAAASFWRMILMLLAVASDVGKLNILLESCC